MTPMRRNYISYHFHSTRLSIIKLSSSPHPEHLARSQAIPQFMAQARASIHVQQI